MKAIKFLLAGVFFGIVMFKSEAASWYRIFEMFQFDAFHMYGVMGSALVVGVIGIKIIKHFRVKTFENEPIELCEKQKGYKRYLFGGTIFGLGWALSRRLSFLRILLFEMALSENSIWSSNNTSCFSKSLMSPVI